MKLAFYVGTHVKDDLFNQFSAGLTRLVQKGPYADYTHVEAIHIEHDDGTVTIASSSARDGGVRSTRVMLTPEHWVIIDVPSWDVTLSIDLLLKTRGAKYDYYGAIATAFIGHENDSRWFCNEWVAYPFLKSASNFGPHQLGAIAMSFGNNVTSEFFQERAKLAFNH